MSSKQIARTAIISPNAIIGEGTIVQDYAIIEDDCFIGKNCRIGYHAVLRKGTLIGDYSVFGTHSVSEGDCRIGNYVTIHSQCHITQKATIEDRVFIAPFFIGANTRKIVHGRDFPLIKDGYTIGYGSRIGICVTVMPGVKVGRECKIDANSVVTKDIPDFSHVRGFPAQIIGIVPEEERLKV